MWLPVIQDTLECFGICSACSISVIMCIVVFIFIGMFFVFLKQNWLASVGVKY